MNLTIKNLRTFRGMEGEGFSLVLYIDGRKAGEVFDDARGAELCYRISREDMEALLAYAATLPDPMSAEERAKRGQEPLPPLSRPLSPETDARLRLDVLLEDLVNAAREEKTVRRWIKTKVVYRRKGDKPGAYITVAPPKGQKLTPAFVEQQCRLIRAREGERLDSILNEVLR